MASSSSLVIGGSRGIGHALVKELLERSDESEVIASHRSLYPPDSLKELAQKFPQRFRMLQLDVTDANSLDAFRRNVRNLEKQIGLTIHAAGILHESAIQPEKALEQCNPDALRRYFEVNSIGPLMVAQALLPSMDRKSSFKFAALSAMVGSIGDNRRGGWYGYRSSKAALNQLVRTLANECRIRFPNAAIIALHPGTTETGLSRPFQRNISPEKLYSPEVTASRILSVLEGVGANESGQFLNWDGSSIPW